MEVVRMKKALMTFVIAFVFVCFTGISARAASVITVKEVTNAVAVKLDAALSKKESVTLKVSGTKSDSKKKVEKLRNLIGNVNKQGVVFLYNMKGKDGPYYRYMISKEYANTYVYSCSFIKDLFDRFKTGRLPGGDRWTYECWGPTENELGEADSECAVFYNLYEAYKAEPAGTDIKEFFYNYVKTKTWRDGENPRTFLNKINQRTDGFYEKAAILYAGMFDCENFCELNDVMRVFLIHTSGYFDGDRKTEYGMVYNEKYIGSSDISKSKLMKNLLDNKAVGVCHDFAVYEVCLFKNLGLTCWYNSNNELGHAWSVLKVKNNSGKALWLPFDYGLSPGPVNGQADYDTQEKYDYGFMLRMAGIKGAPLKQNFTIEDFIS